MTPEAVIFDIGNVLVEWHPERHYDRRIGAARREALFAEVDLHAMNLRVDLGASFRAEVEAMADAHPEWRDEILDWHDSWTEMCSPAIPGSVALLRRLRASGVPVFALSNFGVDTYAIAQKRYGFLTEFDAEFISGHLKCMKPDPAIYEIVERETGVAPGALLFADDRPDNVAVAAARGWQTHLFEGAEGWAARLVSAGLLTEAEAAV
jgi:2-haloacid dehalogenase